MNYLDTLGIKDSEIIDDNFNLGIVYKLLHKNEVLKILKGKGYQFVSFRGFFPINDFSESDYYYNYLENQQGNDDLQERNFRSLFNTNNNIG